MRLRVVVAAMALVLVSGCGDETVLERGGPRIPDDAGPVSNATLARIQLEGKRTYQIHESVESFKTRSHRITPLLSWEGKYVHLGLDDDKNVLWIAGIGTVIKGKPDIVIYSGVFERFDRSTREAFFEDGTVLKLAGGVDAPKANREVVCEIEVAKDLVTKLTVP